MSDIHLDLIDHLRVASPCAVKWDDLDGDGAVRHCGQCDLNVHNLSEMTRDEIAVLVAGARGRLCGGFYRRADGTLLTRDCPVGLRAVRARAARTMRRVAAALAMALTGGIVLGRDGAPAGRLRDVPTIAKLRDLVAPGATVPAPPGPFVMGEIAMPVVPPAANGAGSGNDAGTGTDGEACGADG